MEELEETGFHSDHSQRKPTGSIEILSTHFKYCKNEGLIDRTYIFKMITEYQYIVQIVLLES